MRQFFVWKEKHWTGISGKRIEQRLVVGRTSDNFCGQDSSRLIRGISKRDWWNWSKKPPRKYRRRFEQFSAGLKDLSDAALENKFACGLKEEIQSEICKLNLVALEAKMLMTQVLEDDQAVQLKRTHGASRNPSISNKTSGSGPNGSSNQTGSKGIDRVTTTRTITINPSCSSSSSSTTITSPHDSNAKNSMAQSYC